MQWIICYDIRDNKRRASVHKRLKQYSGGYQYSGFEVLSVGPALAFELLHSLAPFITHEDSLLLLRHAGMGPDWQLGSGPSQQRRAFLIWD